VEFIQSKFQISLASLMIKLFLQRYILKYRVLILKETQHTTDFMKLLMKRRNTGVKWTKEEIIQLRSHLKHLSLYIPVLITFVLPFGLFLLPILAEVLDRREKSRMS
jgi:hypothetical protein